MNTPQRKFSIGVDIGGTNTSFGLVTPEGEILFQKGWPTHQFDSPLTLAKSIFQEIKSENFSFKNCVGIGIGAPSANARTGYIHSAANLHWKGDVDIRRQFESFFKLPVAIANDANATACGEAIYGAAKGIKDFAVVTIGTGLGSGIFHKGHLIDGFDGNGGELGHTILIPDGRQCGCGRRGCLETYTSASGIKHTGALLAEDWAGKSDLAEWIHSGKDFSSKTIFDFLKNNDALAQEVFKKTGYWLGIGIANMVTMIGLERIFLFGGPVAAGAALLDPVVYAFREQVIFYYRDKTKIEITGLVDRTASLLGAASLIYFKEE